MKLSIERVREHAYRAITERGHQPKSWWISDAAGAYGEPGYGSHSGTGTQLVLLGSWWIRRDDGTLDSVDRRYSRLCTALEEIGVETVWYDEWIVDTEHCKAYRTSADGYGWMPSYILTEDGQMMTADDDEDTWFDWALNNADRCLSDRFIGRNCHTACTERGWTRFDDTFFETGWHPGQDDKPADVMTAIRKVHPNADVTFTLDATGQFDARWSAWWRLPEED